MDMKLIPAGTFTMGDNSVRSPTYQVTLTKDFHIGVYEVTQEQYEQVVGSNPSDFNGANNPVNNVSWEDAVAFCEKLSALPAEQAAGRVYRLPTEAEWEYACRAGTTTAFSFGDVEHDMGKYAWFVDNSGNTTQAVGEKLPNGWGLYDMYGNVWEWCSDNRAVDYPKGAVTDPVGPSIGSSRVYRGGSFVYDAAFCRTAIRLSAFPSFRSLDGGFRLALSFPSGQSPEAEEVKGAEPAGSGTEGAKR